MSSSGMCAHPAIRFSMRIAGLQEAGNRPLARTRNLTSAPGRTVTLMDGHYLATLSVYQWVIGQTIDFHLTWPDHPRYTVEQGEGTATLTAVGGAQRVYSVGELEKDALISDARAFILDHANTQGLQRGKHTTWRGAEWRKVQVG